MLEDSRVVTLSGVTGHRSSRVLRFQLQLSLPNVLEEEVCTPRATGRQRIWSRRTGFREAALFQSLKVAVHNSFPLEPWWALARPTARWLSDWVRLLLLAEETFAWILGSELLDCKWFQRRRSWAWSTPSSRGTTFAGPSWHTEAHSGNAGLEASRSAGFHGAGPRSDWKASLITLLSDLENLNEALDTSERAFYRSGGSFGSFSKKPILALGDKLGLLRLAAGSSLVIISSSLQSDRSA